MVSISEELLGEVETKHEQIMDNTGDEQSNLVETPESSAVENQDRAETVEMNMVTYDHEDDDDGGVGLLRVVCVESVQESTETSQDEMNSNDEEVQGNQLTGAYDYVNYIIIFFILII